MGRYELGEPAAAYAHYFAPVVEKAELCKRVVRSLEANPKRDVDSLLSSVLREQYASED